MSSNRWYYHLRYFIFHRHTSTLERQWDKMLASLSGFEGEYRIRISFMCEAVGLRLFGHSSNDYHVLICRKLEGPKYQKARER